MDSINSMSDQELRAALKRFDISPGPITDSTRNLYRKKLASLIEQKSVNDTKLNDDDDDDTSDEDFEVEAEELDDLDEDEEEEDEDEEEGELLSELQDGDVTLSRLSNSGLGDMSRANNSVASTGRISRGMLLTLAALPLTLSMYLFVTNNPALLENLKPLRSLTKWISLLLILSPCGYIVYRAIRFYRQLHYERNQIVCRLVSEAVELLQSPDNPTGMMPIFHIRDTLLTPAERETKSMIKLWDRAVKFIEDHESRIKVQLVNLDGEDFRAWKWIGKLPVSDRSVRGQI